MNLTPEQQTVGRRNFLKAVAGVPALAGLGVAAAVKGPVRGGPVRVGFIGVGGEGRVLLGEVDPQFGTSWPWPISTRRSWPRPTKSSRNGHAHGEALRRMARHGRGRTS